ncbi:hypothetical protein ACGF5M_04065 [Gemmatimonadota bacterium]
MSEDNSHVFINCPFDEAYSSFLRPLLFTIIVAGYEPRIASERSDAAEPRITKLCELISESNFGIHDMSRRQTESSGGRHRLNMAFELGLTYGYRVFSHDSSMKFLLLVESDPYSFKRALSDFSGMDIQSHNNEPSALVLQVRNWFYETVGVHEIPPGTRIWYDFNDFMADFYETQLRIGAEGEDLQMMPVPELIKSMKDWLEND